MRLFSLRPNIHNVTTNSPASSLRRALASEMAVSPDEPALNCTQPAGGVVVPESSA